MVMMMMTMMGMKKIELMNATWNYSENIYLLATDGELFQLPQRKN